MKIKTRIRNTGEYGQREYRVECLEPFEPWRLIAICFNYNFARKVAKLFKEGK